MKNAFELTIEQNEIYFNQKVLSDCPIYTAGGYVEIGVIDNEKMNQAYAACIKAEPIFRLKFCEHAGAVKQYFSDTVDCTLGYEDFSECSDPRNDALLKIKQYANTVFDIENGPIHFAILMRVSSDCHFFVSFTHHLVLDGWGLQLFLHRVCDNYNGQSEQTQISPDEWKNVIEKDAEYLKSKKYQIDRKFWIEDNQLSIADDNFAQQSGDKDRLSRLQTNESRYVFSDTLTEKAKSLAANLGVHFSHVFFAAMVGFLAKLKSKSSISVAQLLHNRTGKIEKGMLGGFSSIRELICPRSDNLSLADYCTALARSQRALLKHRRFPSSHIISGRSERLVLQNLDFDLTFSYLNVADELVYEGGSYYAEQVNSDYHSLPLLFALYEYKNKGALTAVFNYQLSRYSQTQIDGLFDRYLHFFESALNTPQQLLVQHSLLTDSEIAYQIHQLNQTAAPYPQDQLIHELFDKQVLKSPTSIAVVYEDKSLSYAQLNEAANRLAHYLRAQGVVAETLVGICLERSVALVVSILAVLKAGGAYVPLDPLYPSARLKFMLDDSKLLYLLTQASVTEHLAFADALQVTVIDSEQTVQALNEQPAQNPARLVNQTATTLAYVIYTSGSTGLPKGVCTIHKGVLGFLSSVMSNYSDKELASVLAGASINFDLSVFEIFSPLITGGRCVIANSILSLAEQDYSAHQLSMVNGVPSVIAPLISKGVIPESVTVINLAGESLKQALVNAIYNGSRVKKVFNVYGPTEDTVWSCFSLIARDGQTPPIGRPISNTQVYVLDPHQQLTVLGCVGELCLAGAGLARSYLNQPELTAQRFIRNPFSDDDSERLYRTGDMVRYLPDGNLMYVGRIDEQVKVRGYRIELGEIESQLLTCDTVDCAIVMVREDKPGQKRLVAYVVPVEAASLAKNDATPTNDNTRIAQWRAHLQSVLPEYMMPGVFVVLSSLPLTVSGKVDRKALPEPDMAMMGSGYVAPKNAIEQMLVDIYKALLSLEKVSTVDHFYELGGNSVLIVELQKKIQQNSNFNPTITELYQYTTIVKLANYFGNNVDNSLDTDVDKSSNTLDLSTSKTPSLSNPDHQGLTDIAIIGMSCRFPDADSPDKFWQNIRAGKESIHYFTDEQLVATNNNPPHNVLKSGFILDDLEYFDADYFGFTPQAAKVTDPQIRHLLECSQDALSDGGYEVVAPDCAVGVFVGIGQNRYFSEHVAPWYESSRESSWMEIQLGNFQDFAATTISHKLNLTGPGITLGTGCSTSLVAVHQACLSIMAGDSAMALAGACSLRMLKPEITPIEEGGILSPEGTCRTFDADANGTRLGSGAGVVLLKSLQKAIDDGDNIHGIIKGSAVNNDGADKVGFTAPGVQGQASVLRTALERSTVGANTIGYVESHGTGTLKGDPIEFAGLQLAYAELKGKNSCALSSVKPNIGHLDSAAGIAGLIKVCQALKHKEIPPQINFKTINSEINIDDSPFYITRSPMAWPSCDGPRRAAVSSFGIGGTNAHLIVEQPPETPTKPLSSQQCASDHKGASEPQQLSRQHLVVLSARTQSSLKANATRLLAHIDKHPELNIEDIAYTLALGRKQHAHYALSVCDSVSELKQALASIATSDTWHPATQQSHAPAIVFMLPVESQLNATLVNKLYQHEGVFRAHFDTCAALISAEFGTDILAATRIQSTHSTHSTPIGIGDCRYTEFSFQYALVKLWCAWGIEPDLIIAQAHGELVAGCIADVFSLRDALTLIASTDEQQDKTSQTFEPALKKGLKKPEIPFISNLTGQPITVGSATSDDYWFALADQAGSLSPGVDGVLQWFSASDHQRLVFLDIGMDVGLSTLALDCHAQDTQAVLVSSFTDPNHESSMISALAQLFQAGANVAWQGVFEGRQGKRISLPTYCYDKTKHWIDATVMAAQSTPFPDTNKSVDLKKQFYRHSWEKRLVKLAHNTGPLTTDEHCVVFGQLSAVVLQLTEKLYAHGGNTLFVTAEDTQHSNTDKFRLFGQFGQAKCDELLDIIKTDFVGPLKIFIVNDKHSEAFNVSTLSDKLSEVGYFLQMLARTTAPLSISLVTVDGFFVNGSEQVDPLQGALMSLCRATAQENDNISLRITDISDRDLTDQDKIFDIADTMIDSFYRESSLQDVAIRDSVLWDRSFELIRDIDIHGFGNKRAVKPGGHYFITGGLGQIGLALAVYLGETYHTSISIVSRRDLPPSSFWPALAEDKSLADDYRQIFVNVLKINQAGGSVQVFKADISDLDEMRGILQSSQARFGAINGVIHCAGAVDSWHCPMDRFDSDRLDTQLSPKAYGVHVLAQLFEQYPVDFIVLMSSLSAVTGGLGFGPYAAANAYMDSFVYTRYAQRDDRWLSINWDGWATEIPADVQHQFKGAQSMMSIELGMRAFEFALQCANEVHLVHSNTDLYQTIKKWRYSGALEVTFDFQAAQATSLSPRGFTLSQQQLESAFVEIWQSALGLEHVSVDDDFFDIGGDSLVAVSVFTKMKTVVDLQALDFTINDLFVICVVSEIAQEIRNRVSSSEKSDEGISENVDNMTVDEGEI
jgi:amino acid adenylation domain-containing protein